MIRRIGTRPWRSAANVNSYTSSFYCALGQHGISIVDTLDNTDDHLRQHSDEYEAIHLQWIENYWPRNGLLRRLKRIIGLWKYLRTARRLGMRILITMHNTEPHESFDWIDRVGFRIVARNSDLLICHSRAAAREIRRRDKPLARIVVMHHGNYNDSYPKPRDSQIVRGELGLDPDVPVVSCLGILRTYKGIDLAIAAAQQLIGDVQLLVAGSPFEGFPLAQLQRAMTDVPQARLVSRRLSDQEFVDYLSASDLVLLPYRKITGSGALLAAWSQKRCVVASDLEFFREVFETAGGGGAMFQSGDAKDLVRKIREELAKPLAEREAAAFSAANQFAWDQCVEPVIDAMSELGESRIYSSWSLLNR